MTVNFIPKWKDLQPSLVEVGPDPEGRTFFVKTSLLVEIASKLVELSSNYRRFRVFDAKDYDNYDTETYQKILAIMESVFFSYAAVLDSIGRLVGESLDGKSVTFSFPEREATQIRMQKYASDLAAVRNATRGLATAYQRYTALQRLGYASPEELRDYFIRMSADITTSKQSAGVGINYLYDLFEGSANKEVRHLARGFPLYPLKPADIVSGRTYRLYARGGTLDVALFGPFLKDGFGLFRAVSTDGPVIMPDYSRRIWLLHPAQDESAVFEIPPTPNNNVTTDDPSSATEVPHDALSRDLVEVGPDLGGRKFLVAASALAEISSHCGHFHAALTQYFVAKDDDNYDTETYQKILAIMESVFFSYAAVLDSIGRLVGESLDGKSVTFSFPEREATQIRMQKYASDLAAVRNAVKNTKTNRQEDKALRNLGYKNYGAYKKYVSGMFVDLNRSLENSDVGIPYVASISESCMSVYNHYYNKLLDVNNDEPGDE